MSALVIQSVLNMIREEKQRQPDKYPDYEPPNQAQEFEEVRTMFREIFGDKPIDPEQLRKTFELLKTILEVKKA
jgi:rubrerythrin